MLRKQKTKGENEMSKAYRQLCWTCQHCDSCNKCEFVKNLDNFYDNQKRNGYISKKKNGCTEYIPPAKEQKEQLYIKGTMTDKDGYITYCPKYKKDTRPSTQNEAIQNGTMRYIDRQKIKIIDSHIKRMKQNKGEKTWKN